MARPLDEDVGHRRDSRYLDDMTSRPSAEFMSEHGSLEAIYAASDDPIEQSGFRGGRERWVAERSPLIGAIDRDGEFLDVGCANGLLAEDVASWAADQGFRVVPYGIDLGSSLVALARDRLPQYASNFATADVWDWAPKRTWTYVYCLVDVAPDDMRRQLLDRLYRLVGPSGRLVLGSYRSSAGDEPVQVEEVLKSCGYEVDGTAGGGANEASRFAWTTAKA